MSKIFWILCAICTIPTIFSFWGNYIKETPVSLIQVIWISVIGLFWASWVMTERILKGISLEIKDEEDETN